MTLREKNTKAMALILDKLTRIGSGSDLGELAHALETLTHLHDRLPAGELPTASDGFVVQIEQDAVAIALEGIAKWMRMRADKELAIAAGASPSRQMLQREAVAAELYLLAAHLKSMAAREQPIPHGKGWAAEAKK